MPARSRKYPVVLSVPVNLHYFPSVTARILVPFPFAINWSREDSLANIIEEVSWHFKRVDRGEIEGKNEPIVALEHNAFMRVVPLFI